MDGQVGWRAKDVSAKTPEAPGSFEPTHIWADLIFSSLDLLIPVNSIEGCALHLATFKQIKDKLVA